MKAILYHPNPSSVFSRQLLLLLFLSISSCIYSQSRVAKSHQALRALSASTLADDTGTIYTSVINGIPGNFIFDPNDITSADDSVMVIVSKGKRLKRVYEYIDPAWWGAKPDDNVEDTYPIQRAINWALTNYNGKPIVRFSRGGSYWVSDLVIAKYVNGQPTFVSITIEGPAPGVDVGFGGVIFYNKFAPKCNLSAGLHIMLSRNVVIRNIIFRGPVPQPQSQVWDRKDSEWTNNGAISNGRYNPTAAITVDAFHTGVAIKDRYKNVQQSYYTNAGAGGTSNLLVENCAFYDYMVGLAESPGSIVNNGDNIIVRGGYAYNVRNLWAACQTQSRANLLDGIYIVGQVECVVNGVNYGTQNGTIPTVTNSSLNLVKYLYFSNSQFTDVKFINCYGEEVWSLGRSTSPLPTNFTDCNFNFRGPQNEPKSYATPVMAESNGPITFTGGKLEWSDNLWFAPLSFNAQSVSFHGTLLRTGLPSLIGLGGRMNDANRVYFHNTNWSIGASQGNPLSENTHLSEINDASVPRWLLPGSSAISDNKMKYENVGQKFEKIFIGTVAVVRNGSAKTASFTTPTPGNVSYGDQIYCANTLTPTGTIFSATPTMVGWVSEVKGAVVTITYIPEALVNGTYSLYIYRMPEFTGRFLGNVTSGSKVITNIVTQRQPWSVNAKIKGLGIPAGAYVTASTPSTITISQNATGTYKNVELFDASVKVTASNEYYFYMGGWYNPFNAVRIWFRGDEIFNRTNEPANISSWYIKAPGLMTSTTQPPELITLGEVPQSGEDVTLVSTKNFTVPASAKVVNLIYEYPAGGGMLTLPAGPSADKLTVYLNNASAGVLNFNQRVFSGSSSSRSSIGAGTKTKLIYKNSEGKWYVVQ